MFSPSRKTAFVAWLALTAAGTATVSAFAPISHVHMLQHPSAAAVTAATATASNLASQQPTSSTQCNALPSLMTSDVLSIPADVSSSYLTTYFYQTLIANGVPAICTIVVIGFAAVAFRRSSNRRDFMFGANNPFKDPSNNPASVLYEDLYGDQEQKKASPLAKLFAGPSGGNDPLQKSTISNKNVGVPKERFIKLTNLNRKYDSFQYSITAATQSKAKAAAQFRQAAFGRALQTALSSDSNGLASMEPQQQRKLLEWEAILLKDGGERVEMLTEMQSRLTEITIDTEMEELGLSTVYQLDPSPVNATNATSTTTTKSPSSSEKKATKESNKKLAATLQTDIAQIQMDLQNLETEALKSLLKIAGPTQAAAVRTAWLGNVAVRGIGSVLQDLQDRPLKTLFASNDARTPVLYVTRFPGDTTASQVATLREEVTAIVRSGLPGDEVLMVLQTGGGTVTGYGLAAAQLQRIKDAGLKLTVAVEQVAASGGYLMCCVADRIVASPFAVLGSIGVISDIPNVYERLRSEGIEFQTVTAGKYKRTLTPTKKPSKEDFQKSKQDVEDILILFRDWVALNRPALDIDRVATGETWFGKNALELNLCDEILAVDDVFTDYVDRGFDVFEIEYSPPETSPINSLLSPVRGSDEDTGLFGRAIRWTVRTVASEVKAELGNVSGMDKPVQERYMAKNDDSERVRTEA